MTYLSETTKHRGFLSRLASLLPALSRGHGSEFLDVRGLSDHLKRDMGFLDGVPTQKRR